MSAASRGRLPLRTHYNYHQRREIESEIFPRSPRAHYSTNDETSHCHPPTYFAYVRDGQRWTIRQVYSVTASFILLLKKGKVVHQMKSLFFFLFLKPVNTGFYAPRLPVIQRTRKGKIGFLLYLISSERFIEGVGKLVSKHCSISCPSIVFRH